MRNSWTQSTVCMGVLSWWSNLLCSCQRSDNFFCTASHTCRKTVRQNSWFTVRPTNIFKKLPMHTFLKSSNCIYSSTKCDRTEWTTATGSSLLFKPNDNVTITMLKSGWSVCVCVCVCACELTEQLFSLVSMLSIHNLRTQMLC
jgi:hypothetical protein